jgi:hypothetical protein
VSTQIKASKLRIEIPTKVLSIENIEIVEELNEHGKAKVNIITEDEEEFELISKLTKTTEVKLAIEDEENPKVLFIGIPTKLKMSRKEMIFEVEIELKSKSYKLDQKIRSRSFQNKEKELKKLFKEVIGEYGYEAFYTAEEGALQGESIIQFYESDWNFIKRVGSKVRAKIVTSVDDDNAYICVGPLEGKEGEEETHGFNLVQEKGEYLKSQINYGEWKMEHKMEFEIESTKEYKIYDKITYKKLEFVVVKKKVYIDKGIIAYKYNLLKEEGIRQDLIVNEKIQGASIDGKVLDIEGDRVKIHLSIDEEQAVDEAYWYKYETAYATEGTTGLYTMPQKGDEVKLYIPLDYKERGYVRTVNRLDGKENIKTQDPKVKYYGTIDKKELMLAPSEFQVTATNGMILINMDDKDGIEITSSDDIVIHTEEEGFIKGDKIELRAGNEILLRTRNSSIIVDEEINIKADGTVLEVQG